MANNDLYKRQYELQLVQEYQPPLTSLVEMISKDYKLCGDATITDENFFDTMATKHYDIDINSFNRKTKYAMAKDLLFVTNMSDHRMKVIFTPTQIFTKQLTMDIFASRYDVTAEKIEQDKQNYILKYFAKVGLLLCTNVLNGVQSVVFTDTPSIILPTDYTVVHERSQTERLCVLTIQVKYNLDNAIEKSRYFRDKQRDPSVNREVDIISSWFTMLDKQFWVFGKDYYGLTMRATNLSDPIYNRIISTGELTLTTPVNYTSIRRDLADSDLNNLLQLRLNLSNTRYNSYEHISTQEWYTILMGIAMLYKSNTIFLVQRFLSSYPGEDRIPLNISTSADTFKIVHFNKMPTDIEINKSIIVELYGEIIYIHPNVSDDFIKSYSVTQPQQDNIVEVCYSKSANASAITKYRQINPYFHTFNRSYMFFEQPIWIIDKFVQPSNEISLKHFKSIANVNMVLEFFKEYEPIITNEVLLDTEVSVYCVSFYSKTQPRNIQSLLTGTQIQTQRRIFEMCSVWVVCSKDDTERDIRKYEDILAVKCVESNSGNAAISTILEMMTRHRLSKIASVTS